VKKIIATALVVTAGAALVGCTSGTAGPDQRGLHYDAGPIAGAADFEACYGPSSRSIDDFADKHFEYPFGQRTFDFSTAEEADSGAISVVSKDNVTMTVSGVATFALNPTCDVLQEFHERIGLKYGAWEEGGWISFLNVYLKQPLDKAMDAVSKEYGYRDLYSNPEVKEEWEAKVGALVAREVESLAGAPYLCSASFVGAESQSCGDLSLTIQTPQPPENIVNALASEQQAVAENEAQKQRNATVVTELESTRLLVDVLGPEAYVLLKAIEDGRITVFPVPGGSNINLAPPAAQ